VRDGELVYSTEGGDHRKSRDSLKAAAGRAGGPVRVRRETSGRRGKTVTVVRGLPGADLAAVCADLKKRCGAGGAVKDGDVEIQGDHRDTIVARLLEQGFAAKPAGG
jgi:translation initiation factor 1